MTQTIITTKELQNVPGAVALIDNFPDHTDPKYIGPGTWNVIHRIAFKAKNTSEQLAFIVLMKEICEGFTCKICQGHCKEYIKNNPLEEYLNVYIKIVDEVIHLGMFIWTWKFHNAVNSRIKKPLMSWDTAFNLYSATESLVCSKNCLAADMPPDGDENKITPPQYLSTKHNSFRMLSVRSNKRHN